MSTGTEGWASTEMSKTHSVYFSTSVDAGQQLDFYVTFLHCKKTKNLLNLKAGLYMMVVFRNLSFGDRALG